MQTIRAHTGALPETPLFSVYLSAMRGPRAQKILIQAEPNAQSRYASDAAWKLALAVTGAPEAAFVAVYHEDVAPRVSGKFGAPMGRQSGNLDHGDYSLWRAKTVQLDSQGYDKGGAYWGLRPHGQRLYAVQDGMGNIAYVVACSRSEAIENAKGE